MDITTVFGTVISGSSPDGCTNTLKLTHYQFHMKLDKTIPKEILDIISTLQAKGFEAQIVGGSVRDILLGQMPKDWDINTNALPHQILTLFRDSFYENEFGTVGVKLRDVSRETSTTKISPVSSETINTEIAEITPYRKEGIYKDGRHPDSVSFGASLEDDLKRRDFTINAIALDPIGHKLYFLEDGALKDSVYEGKLSLKDIGLTSKGHALKDILDKVIRAVGNPSERFQEDYLRMLRAIRLACQLGFSIEKETEKAIIDNSSKLSSISRERVRDELVKIFMTPTPMVGFLMLQYTGLLNDILPELLLGVGMMQTVNHKYDVYGHLLRSMQHASDKGYTLEMRVAALLHDIAKPHTCRWVEKTKQNSFHGHEVVGERVSREILTRLKFPMKQTEKICKLVRWHMFNSDPDQVTMSAVRRMIVNVGRENIWDLMNLRFCDRIGSGRPLEEPYRLRRYFAMIEEALTQPTDLKMLKIDGKGIMDVSHETPGPRIGLILNALMGEVLENPELNTIEALSKRTLELTKLELTELKELALKGKDEIGEAQMEKTKTIRKKFKV
jgi:tRNA nucleotidyltransferase (CCA-adding enzyme)